MIYRVVMKGKTVIIPVALQPRMFKKYGATILA